MSSNTLVSNKSAAAAAAYVLAHTPEHLAEAQDHGELRELVKTDDFLDAQARAFASNDLSVHTLDIAYQLASDEHNAALMVEYGLRRALRFEMQDRRNPWSEWVAGNIQSAIELACQADAGHLNTGRDALWMLLFIEDVRKREPAIARQCFESLRRIALRASRVSGWKAEQIARLLTELADFDDGVPEIAEWLLEDDHLKFLAVHLAEQQKPRLSWAVARRIKFESGWDNTGWKKRWNAKVAVAQVLIQCNPQADKVFSQILADIRQIHYASLRSSALINVARVLEQIGNAQSGELVAEAVQIARQTPEGYDRSSALIHIAESLPENDSGLAAQLFTEALAEAGKETRYPSLILENVIEALWRTRIPQAIDLLSEALAKTLPMVEEAERLRLSAKLNTALAEWNSTQADHAAKLRKGGEGMPSEPISEDYEVLSRAFEETRSGFGTMHRRGGLGDFVNRVGGICTAWAHELLLMALADARQIQWEADRLQTLEAVAEALDRSGNPGAREALWRALANVRPIRYQVSRVSALAALAQALERIDSVQAGELFNEALGAACGIPDEQERSLALMALAEALGQCTVAEVDQLLGQALSETQKISGSCRSRTLAAVAQAFKRRGSAQASELFSQAWNCAGGNSRSYREFEAEREEVLKHQRIESEKAGHDIGFEHALTDWIIKYRSQWRKNRLSHQQQAAASISFPDTRLLTVVRKAQAGENDLFGALVFDPNGGDSLSGHLSSAWLRVRELAKMYPEQVSDMIAAIRRVESPGNAFYQRLSKGY